MYVCMYVCMYMSKPAPLYERLSVCSHVYIFLYVHACKSLTAITTRRVTHCHHQSLTAITSDSLPSPHAASTRCERPWRVISSSVWAHRRVWLGAQCSPMLATRRCRFTCTAFFRVSYGEDNGGYLLCVCLFVTIILTVDLAPYIGACVVSVTHVWYL